MHVAIFFIEKKSSKTEFKRFTFAQYLACTYYLYITFAVEIIWIFSLFDKIEKYTRYRTI